VERLLEMFGLRAHPAGKGFYAIAKGMYKFPVSGWTVDQT